MVVAWVVWRTGLDATAFNGDTSKERAREILNAVADPEATLQLLYVTPEKFVKSKSLLNKLEKVRRLRKLRYHIGLCLTRLCVVGLVWTPLPRAVLGAAVAVSATTSPGRLSGRHAI